MSSRPKASREARGYGPAHRRRRELLEPQVRAGLVACCRCGQLIKPGERWALDHRDDRRGYNGAAHAVCNARAGAAKANENRARTRELPPLRWSREWFVPEPGTVVDYGDGRIVKY
jgi:hypothetical protein